MSKTRNRQTNNNFLQMHKHTKERTRQDKTYCIQMFNFPSRSQTRKRMCHLTNANKDEYKRGPFIKGQAIQHNVRCELSFPIGA